MADLATLTSTHRYFPGGMDSFTEPAALTPDFYVYSQNVLSKGGRPHTRPGSTTLYCLPYGKLQGGCLFTPRNGVEHLVAAVDGRIYVAPEPFDTYRLLTGIRFNPNSPMVTFVPALKSTEYNAVGEIVAIEEPYDVLIMQDNAAQAAYWDGGFAAHSDPRSTPKDSPTYDGRDGIRIGLHGVFSGNRYWVARGRLVFASDLGNPIKFKDSVYLAELPAFILPDDCTGMIETADRSGILCFYESGADFIETSIQDRTQWADTPNMLRPALEVGCVAPRSLCTLHNMLYWFSPKGWINLDSALSQNQSSEIITLDPRMIASKCAIGPDLSEICAGTFENMVLVSVPFCSLSNAHTWVLDVSVAADTSKHWASVWTGWQPVQWASGIVNGAERVFAFCSDADGANRVWEMMQPDHRDNGCDITCSMQLRQDSFNADGVLKKFSHAVVELGSLQDRVSAMVAVAGERGWFERIATAEIEATYRRVLADVTYGDGTTEYPRLADSKEQVRLFKTEELKNPGECNECGIESRLQTNIDFAFSLVIAWSGVASLRAVTAFAKEWTDALAIAGCEEPEEGYRVKDATGCGTFELFTETEGNFPRFEATATYSGVGLENGLDAITSEACAFSQISQLDADRRAQCRALFQYNRAAFMADPPIGSFEFGCNRLSLVGGPILGVYNEAGTVPVDLADLGSILWGTTGTLVLRLVNEGDGVLELTGIEFSGEGIEHIDGPEKTLLDPGEFTFITLAQTVPNFVDL